MNIKRQAQTVGLKRDLKVKRLNRINMQNVKLLAFQYTVVPEFAFS